MIDIKHQRIVRVIGHKNPDTDSICSAIAYAYLKNQISNEPHEPRRAGDINKETEFVLNYFGVKKPRLTEDAAPAIGNIDIRQEEGIDGEMSLRDAWQEMMNRDIDTLCVVEPAEAEDGAARADGAAGAQTDAAEEHRKPVNLRGLLTIRDIANANMDLLDQEVLSKSATSYRNLVSVLQGKLLTGDPDAVITRGKLGVGTSPEVMDGFIDPGDIMLVTNRYETQICAIDNNVGCLIVCTGAAISDSMLKRAKEKNISVTTTDLDTFGAARLISMAAPVRYYMKSDDLIIFNIHTPVEEARKVMATTRHRYFPVVDKDGHYIGVISRRNLLNLHKKKFILVDHNEQEQAVDGLENAEVLEIIDHHRIGDLETGSPVYFRNEPVGCTSTILYTIYQENDVEIPREIAGLMLSAILSDTLVFHSPTCTGRDRAAAKALAEIAGVDIETYGREMFEAGEDLTGRSPEEILTSDFKEFALGEYRVSVGQGFFMSEKAFAAAREMVGSILPVMPQKAGVNIVLYMLTSIPKQGTLLLFAGENAEATVRAAFLGEEAEEGQNSSSSGNPASAVAGAPAAAGSGTAGEIVPSPEVPAMLDGALWLPGIVSRKKQLIPPIREKLLEK